MPTYQLTYKRSVAKDLRLIQTEHRKEIVKRIEALAKHPRPAGSIKLRGAQDFYRFRYADYRVIYQIDDDKVIILVIKVGHRKDVYKHR